MSGGHDDLIVQLMSMGFELQDCQEAINFGKTSVESAVEWIVAGKPGLGSGGTAGVQESSGANLRLRPTSSEFGSSQSAAPFQKPHPITKSSADTPTSETGQSGQPAVSPSNQCEHSPSEGDTSEVKIISRMHMSDSQRQYKQRFEQKKIDEARKQAVLEKRRHKEEHARILKEIAEDRETKRLITHAPSSSQNVPSASAKGQPDGARGKSTEGSQAREDADSQANQSTAAGAQSSSSLLQIRLPDGRSLRHSFSPGAVLQDVWNFTAKQYRDLTGYIFIQPFPRHEYSEADMSSTLTHLRLTPTGSLVLQKKQQHTQQPGEEPMDTGSSSTIAAGDTMSCVAAPTAAPSTPNAPVLPRAPPAHMLGPGAHRWGTGQSLEGQNTHNVPANEDEDLMEEEEEEGENPILPHMGLGRGRGGMAHNMPHPPGNMMMGGGLDMMGMMGGPPQAGAFGGQGQRLVDQAEHGFHREHEHRSARDLASERALARYAQPVVVLEPTAAPGLNPAPTALTSSALTSHVTSLLAHCLRHIANRLNDPRHQLLSLAGISEDMAQVILEFLLKEMLLKPKTLNAFIPCYLRRLILDCYPYTTNELLHSVRLHTNLSQLSVSGCPLITDQGLHSLNSLKKLKKLNLSCCPQLSNKCLTILSCMPELVALNLEQTGVTDAGVIQFLQTRPAHLLHLNLNRTAVTAAVFPHITQYASQLKMLSLEGSKLMSLQGMEECLDVESLNVARTGIVTESLLCLRDHPNLLSLNIADTDNVIGDMALQNLQGLSLHTLVLPSRLTTTNVGIAYLSEFPLTSLDLTNYIYVGDEAMQSISNITSLKKLLLSNTKLTDEGILYLEGLKHLEVLHLDRTLITDESASVIGALTSLIDLSMSCTGLTSKFLLSGAFNNCTNLSKLNLSKTLVTNKGVLTLALPFLVMLNLDGTKVSPDLPVVMSTRSPGCPRLTQISMRNLEPFTRDDEIAEAEMME